MHTHEGPQARLPRRGSLRLPTAGAAAGLLAGTLLLTVPAPGSAQVDAFQAKPPPAETRDFDGFAQGPYDRLVIRDVMVIPGHGGPPTGPHDLLIEGNVITEMQAVDPVTLAEARAAGQPVERFSGDRVIEGEGMYVMPGMVDLHHHPRDEPVPLEYTYYLKLAHGVTTSVPGAGIRTDEVHAHHEAAERYEYLAPRMFPIWRWGRGTDATLAELQDPEEAPRIAQEMVAGGAHVIDVGRGEPFWTPELLTAVATAVREAGGVTTFHIPPSTTSVIQAVDAARAGVTMIEHHYGYAEAARDRKVQDWPRDYNYDDENHRFREAGRVWLEAGENPVTRERLLGQVADSLVAYGATMLPTRVVYEANRDILRAMSLPWHERYTHQALIDLFVPSVDYHGAYHWDWTHDDEYYWTYAFDLWGRLIYEFNKRGGRVAYGSDDNFIWATAGFSNIRELQLMRESGMHSHEVLRSATYNSAQTLRQSNIGLIHPGYLADLVLVDGNPAENFRHMYHFGAIRMGENREMYRSRGIVHTVKDGVVIENQRLMEEVARMVAESKAGVAPDITRTPFIPDGR